MAWSEDLDLKWKIIKNNNKYSDIFTFVVLILLPYLLTPLPLRSSGLPQPSVWYPGPAWLNSWSTSSRTTPGPSARRPCSVTSGPPPQTWGSPCYWGVSGWPAAAWCSWRFTPGDCDGIFLLPSSQSRRSGGRNIWWGRRRGRRRRRWRTRFSEFTSMTTRTRSEAGWELTFLPCI